MELNELYKLYKQSYLITTNTRSNLKNSIFFSLKGDNFNGNTYAEIALKKGANYAIVDEKKYQTSERIILVNDSLKTLQDLSSYHRKQLNIPIVALTGSNGKTTTKELIHTVLNQEFECVATQGNLNNHIGVPLTLLSMTPDTEIGVVEMGANHHDEIDFLCNIAHPDFGYITNFGRVHLEGFGSLTGVIEAKTEMYRYLQKRDKNIFINANDPIQIKETEGMQTITFCAEKSNFPIQFIKANPFVKVRFNNKLVTSKLIGKYNFTNIAAAISIGSYMDIPDDKIVEAIENYVPTNNRSQIIKKGTNQIILDAYNANPNSMEVAIENLSQLTAKNKIAILGDMFEVGEGSVKEHEKVVELTQNSSINKTYFIGNIFSEIDIQSPKIIQFNTFDDFKNSFESYQFSNAIILIKASRGMALERVIDLL